MHKLLLEFPDHIETERLNLRGYKAGDGAWYYRMGLKNRAHLARYEAGNAAMTLQTEEEGEILVREFAAAWVGRRYFFLGAFEKDSGEFVAQIYIGAANWDLPEFEIGYFADQDHEGQGYVTEAVRGALKLIFQYMKAYRVRLECDDTNERSRRVAERCGFVKEAHFRQNKKNPDGTISGTLCYGLLSSEFK